MKSFKIIIFVALLATLFVSSASYASTFTVISLADNGGSGELRAAITSANAKSGSTITFQSGLNGTITLTSALPPITTTMTIQGSGASVITVDGAGQYRPFNINASGDTVAISGLTIQHGSDQADNAGGAGIGVSTGSLNLSNCTLSDNTSTNYGGGLGNSGTATLTNCTLSGNSALGGAGLAGNGTTTLTNCTFSGNTATEDSGSIASDGVIMLNNCTISDNTGGGFINGGTATLISCTLSGNSNNGSNGGGGAFSNSGIALLTNCTISGNTAPSGGGIGNYNPGTATFSDCTVVNNIATGPSGGGDGGGLYNNGAAYLTNCTFYGNQTTDNISGGGIESDSGSTITLENCTLSGNRSSQSGNNGTPNGGLEAYNSTAILTNCILYGDTGVEITTGNDGSVTATYSDIQGGYAGTGNINANPLLVALANNGGSTETMALGSGSPCLAVVPSANEPATDQRGYTRPTPEGSIGAWDAGASASSMILSIVAPSSTTAGSAFSFIVTAVTPGVGIDTSYSGTVHFSSSDSAASLPANTTLTAGYGQFSATLNTIGSQTLTATDTAKSSITVASGITVTASTGSATHFSVSAPANTTVGTAFNVTVTALNAGNNTATGYTGMVHISSSDGAATIPTNATLTNGVGKFSVKLNTVGSETVTATDTTTSSITGTSGSIIVSAASSNPLVVTNTLDSSATGSGSLRAAITYANAHSGSTITFQSGLSGTIHLSSALPSITTSMTIQGPGASAIMVNGAGEYRPISIQGSAPTVVISGLTIQNGSDQADGGGGGGVTMQSGNLTLNNCTISGNNAESGGGIGNHATLELNDCTVVNNIATGPNGGGDGGGLYSNGTAYLTNCTFYGNQTTDNISGGGIESDLGGTITLMNCTLSGNNSTQPGNSGTPNGGLEVFGASTLTNCILYGDAGEEITTNGSGSVNATYSDIEGGYAGLGNINANPLLISIANNGGTTETMALTAGSPCFKAGTASGAPATDQRDVTRPNPPSMGAWDDPSLANDASHFSVSAPSTAMVGSAISVTVTALTANNATATSYTDMVQISSSDGAASLPANATLTNGVGTFNITLNTAGSQTVSAADTVASSITGRSGTIIVALPATHFSVSAPSTATAGTAISVTVTALNTSNATVTGYTGTIQISSSDPEASLPTNATLTNGVGTFSVTFNTSGYQTITATDSVTSSITGTSGTISVAAGTRVVQIQNMSGTPGGTVVVPITIVSYGTENTLEGSLEFNPTVLTYSTANLSSGDANANLQLTTTQTAIGKLGFDLALPSGQALTAGTQQVLLISFTIAAGATSGATTPIGWIDTPIARELVDINAIDLTATFTGGTVSIVTGYEGDPLNAGKVTLADWVKVGRYAAGLDPQPTGLTYQEADCAPRSTLGSGKAINLADWVQTGRYEAGLDPLTPVGGPTTVSSSVRENATIGAAQHHALKGK